MKKEKEIDKKLYPDYDWDESTTEPSKKKSIFRKILTGLGYGSLFVSGGIITVILYILNFLFVAFVALSVIGWAIILFMEGSILWGLLVLLILTPLAIELAHWLFFYWIILMVFSLILWGVVTIFGLDISFWEAGSIIWLLGKIAILGIMALFGIMGFIEAIKERDILEFFKDYWLGILFFCFLFWLFFL
jgi:hypothetical protein